MQSHHYSKRGQALVIIAVGMIALIALTALSIDGGNAYSDRRHAQNAADTSALAAALAKVRLETDWKGAGFARAANNGYDNNGTTNTVQIISPPATGIYSCSGSEGVKLSPYSNRPACNEYIQVTITSQVKTYFAPIVGVRQVTNTVQSVVRAIEGGPFPPNREPAINATSPHACDALKIHGGNTVKVIGGGFFINSDCKKYALNGDGNPNVDADKCIKVVGGYDSTHINFTITNPDPGCSSVVSGVDPYPETADPNIVCPTDPIDVTITGTGSDKTAYVLPGYWDGSQPFPKALNANRVIMQSGTYCINNGGFDPSTMDVTGHDVLIYVKRGGFSIASNANIQLDAPGHDDPGVCDEPTADNPFPGLLLYVDRHNTEPVSINGGSNLSIEGSIRAPGSACSLLGGGDQNSPIYASISCDTVELGGSSNLYLKFDPCVSYKPMVKPILEQTK